MAVSTSFFDAEPTFLGALTTTFTPPASCFGTTAAVDSDDIPFQMFTGGIGSDGGISSKYYRTECFPSGYKGNPLDNYGAYYSPGFCPYGYTTAATMIQSSETRAICCLEGLGANNLLGCTKSFTNGLLTASEYFTVAPSGPYPIETGVRSAGDIDLLGCAIEVRNRGDEDTSSIASSRPFISASTSTSAVQESSITRVDSQTHSLPTAHETLTVVTSVSTSTSAANSWMNRSAKKFVKLSVAVLTLVLFPIM